jgi:hypothetical protein
MMVNRSQDVKEATATREVMPVIMTTDGPVIRAAGSGTLPARPAARRRSVVSVESETPERPCGPGPPPRSVSAPDCKLADDLADCLRAMARSRSSAVRDGMTASRVAADHHRSADAGWRVIENTRRGADARSWAGGAAIEAAQGHDPTGQRPVAGYGPGQVGLHSGQGQLQTLRRRD